jgi:hypothetical protein
MQKATATRLLFRVSTCLNLEHPPGQGFSPLVSDLRLAVYGFLKPSNRKRRIRGKPDPIRIHNNSVHNESDVHASAEIQPRIWLIRIGNPFPVHRRDVLGQFSRR